MMRCIVFSFSTTPKFAPQLPYLQHSRLPSLVMVLLVSSDLSLCIQVRWFTGWCVHIPHVHRIELTEFQNLPTVSIFQGIAYKSTYWRAQPIHT